MSETFEAYRTKSGRLVCSPCVELEERPDREELEKLAIDANSEMAREHCDCCYGPLMETTPGGVGEQG